MALLDFVVAAEEIENENCICKYSTIKLEGPILLNSMCSLWLQPKAMMSSINSLGPKAMMSSISSLQLKAKLWPTRPFCSAIMSFNPSLRELMLKMGNVLEFTERKPMPAGNSFDKVTRTFTTWDWTTHDNPPKWEDSREWYAGRLWNFFALALANGYLSVMQIERMCLDLIIHYWHSKCNSLWFLSWHSPWDGVIWVTVILLGSSAFQSIFWLVVWSFIRLLVSLQDETWLGLFVGLLIDASNQIRWFSQA